MVGSTKEVRVGNLFSMNLDTDGVQCHVEEKVTATASLDGRKNWKAIATSGGAVHFFSLEGDAWIWKPGFTFFIPAVAHIIAIGGREEPSLLACGYARGNFARAYERQEGGWNEINPLGGIGFPGYVPLRMLGNDVCVQELCWETKPRSALYVRDCDCGAFHLLPRSWYQFWRPRWYVRKVV